MGELLLGIDLGTTVLKVGVFEAETGRARAAASIRLPVRSLSDGTRQQDPGRVNAALGSAIRAVRAQVGGGWRDLRGLGVCSQGGSAIIAERQTGRALTPMQLWNDARPLVLLDSIAALKPPGYWRKTTFLDAPGAGLARLAWLRRRRPRLFHNANIYVGAGEYLYFALTGQWRQDAGNALQIGCYDPRRHRLAPEPLALVDVPADFVAPMRSGHQTMPLARSAARRFGLPAGLPVAGPYLDHEAGYLGTAGCRGLGETPLQCSLGTAWVGNFVSNSQRPPSGGFNLVLPSPLGEGNLIVRVMLAGALTWEHALATFAGGTDQLNAAERVFAERLLPPPGLVSLPWLTRPSLIDPDLVGGGVVLGVNVHTSAGDLLRSAGLGMCCEFAHLFRGLPTGTFDSVVLTGGASRGKFFRTMLAALFAPTPVYVLDDELFGVRGAVRGLAAGRWTGRARRTALPAPAVRRQIERHYDFHVRTCRSLSAGLKSSLLDAYRHGSQP